MDWRAIKNMRNMFAHDYGSMDKDRIWQTATEDVPALKGYGYFDEIPAAYVLKYLDAFTVKQFLSTGKLWTWYDGTQSIWEGVNNHLKHPALLNSEVTNIKRENDKVFVTVNGKTEEFDKLIICTPLELFLGYGDPREEEKGSLLKNRT